MKKLIQYSVLFLCILSIFACHQQKDLIKNESTKKELILNLKENSLEEFDEQQLINNQEDLENIFVKLNVTRRPGIPSPIIDFEQYSVLLINKKLDNENKGDISLEKIEKGNKGVRLIFKQNGETLLNKIPNSNRIIKLYTIDKVEKIQSIEFEN